MILIAHVIIALSSVAFSTYLFFRPSRIKLHVSYGLIAGTLTSGTYLVASTGTHILEACSMGLLYIGVVAVLTASARRDMAVYRAKKS